MGLATGFLGLKLFLSFIVAKQIPSITSSDRIAGLVAGWLVVNVMQIGIILFLSAFAILKPLYFVISILLCAVLIQWQGRRNSQPMPSLDPTWLRHPATWTIVGVMLLMWLRSLFLYDYTWDAHTYGLPRMTLWMNAGSVFLHYSTPQLNLFVNEWNGELNALAYALFSNSYQGFAFGNIEVLLWLFVAIVWLALLLGLSMSRALILAAIMGTAPAFIGLASTVKGDLLAILGFVMATGWLVLLKKNHNIAAFGFCLISAALAVGSKVSVVFPVAVVVATATLLLRNQPTLNLRSMRVGQGLLLISALLVISARFWENWLVYGNPLKRVDAEKAQFDPMNIVANLDITVTRLFRVFDEVKGHGNMWALSASMGAAAWFIVVAGMFMIASTLRSNATQRSHVSPRYNCYLMYVSGGSLIATLIPMALAQARPWTFRYFAPSVVVAMISPGVVALYFNYKNWQWKLLATLAGLAILVNLGISMRPGEVLPIRNPSQLIASIQQADTALKRMDLSNALMPLALVDALKLDSHVPLNILAFQDVDSPLTPFIGSRAQNKIHLTATPNDLIQRSKQHQWDLVAFAQKKEARDSALVSALDQSGYVTIVNNALFLIAIPVKRLILTPINLNVQWTPFNIPQDAQIENTSASPKISSHQPIDAGFVSQELSSHDPILIRASFEGTVTGYGSHAAHLSWHGVTPLITLPSGHYSASNMFYGILPGQDAGYPKRISFGLGGWGQGSGDLQLKTLELFHMEIKDETMLQPLEQTASSMPGSRHQ